MTIRTALTELLGLRHPVILAPMAFVSGGRLAAAVTRAGGLGLIGGGYGDAAWLRREIAAAGNARTGVGFITWRLASQPHLLDMVLEHDPSAIMLSFGDARPFAPKVKAAGAKLLCQVQTVAQAREAALAGADVVIAQGTEAGGHAAARATLPLVPAVVDAVAPIPVVAAGGIADGRGLAAALMLGAAGVLMGTRFYATEEALAHPAAKQRLIEATGDRTLQSSLFDLVRGLEWPPAYGLRTLENAFSDRWASSPQALVDRADERARYEAAREEGDFDVAAVIAGEAADLVRDLPAAGDLVERVVAEAETLLRRAPGYVA